jgi:hypothetical protein
MHRGYVPLWRKLTESSFYRDSEAVHLWIHILLEANHSKRKEWFGKKELFLSEGQFTTGRKQLSNATGIGESKIQRLLKKFEKCHMIEQQTCSVNRLITITNYKSHKSSEQPSNNERTTSEQQVNNERTHSKNVIKKELKETIYAFEDFYCHYDKKVDRKKSESKYNKINEADRLLIKEHVLKFVECWHDKQFRMSPYRYLNEEHWHDEIIEKQQGFNFQPTVNPDDKANSY